MLNTTPISYLKRLKAALKSRHRAAYLGLFVKAISPFGKLVDNIVSSALPGNAVPDKDIPPCLMIVSPPRAGSTVIYQVLTRVIPCVYISNLHAILPKSASYHLKKRNLSSKDFSNITNYYGYTPYINDVYEGNELIDAIFKGNPDKNLIRKRSITFLRMMRASRERPLIFKNVRNYKNVYRLHEAVPEIVFLRVKRKQEQVIQSELRAYYELGSFHPIPEALAHSGIDDPIEFSVRQIMEIERILDEQKARIDHSKWVEWSYEDFCSSALSMIENLVEKYLNMDLLNLRKKDLSNLLKPSNSVKISTNEADRISLLLRQYDKF